MTLLTCSTNLIERSVGLQQLVSWDVVAQSDRRHRGEAVVEGVEEVPVGLDDGEDSRRNEEDDDEDDAKDDEDVSQSDVEDAERVAQSGHQGVVHELRDDHQPLDERREQDQRQWNSQHCVDDAEDLAAVRQRRHVTVSCTHRDTAAVYQFYSLNPRAPYPILMSHTIAINVCK